MTISRKFYQEIRELSEAESLDSSQVRKDLDVLVGKEKIIADYTTVGETSVFPKNRADIFALTKDCLYDYEITEEGAVSHLFFLSSISGITENIEKDGFFSIHFLTADEVLILADKIERKQQMRKFSSKVKNRILEIRNEKS